MSEESFTKESEHMDKEESDENVGSNKKDDEKLSRKSESSSNTKPASVTDSKPVISILRQGLVQKQEEQEQTIKGKEESKIVRLPIMEKKEDKEDNITKPASVTDSKPVISILRQVRVQEKDEKVTLQDLNKSIVVPEVRKVTLKLPSPPSTLSNKPAITLQRLDKSIVLPEYKQRVYAEPPKLPTISKPAVTRLVELDRRIRIESTTIQQGIDLKDKDLQQKDIQASSSRRWGEVEREEEYVTERGDLPIIKSASKGKDDREIQAILDDLERIDTSLFELETNKDDGSKGGGRLEDSGAILLVPDTDDVEGKRYLKCIDAVKDLCLRILRERSDDLNKVRIPSEDEIDNYHPTDYSIFIVKDAEEFIDAIKKNG